MFVTPPLEMFFRITVILAISICVPAFALAQTNSFTAEWDFNRFSSTATNTYATNSLVLQHMAPSQRATRGNGLKAYNSVWGTWGSSTTNKTDLARAIELDSYIEITIAPLSDLYEVQVQSISLLISALPGNNEYPTQVALFASWKGFGVGDELGDPVTITSANASLPQPITFELNSEYIPGTNTYRLYFITPTGGSISLGTTTSNTVSPGMIFQGNARAVPEANAAGYLVAIGIVWLLAIVVGARKKLARRRATSS